MIICNYDKYIIKNEISAFYANNYCYTVDFIKKNCVYFIFYYLNQIKCTQNVFADIYIAT